MKKKSQFPNLLPVSLWMALAFLVGCESLLTGEVLDVNETDELVVETPDSRNTAPDAQGLLVVHSDYMSTQISGLATDGTLSKPVFLDSGTMVSGLSTALSGDVVLPSHPSPLTWPVVLDRSNGVVTVLEPGTLKIKGQYSVGDAGYGANPHDFVAVSADKAYVSRFGFSAQDIAVINPATGKIAGTIDMAEHAVDAEGATTPTSANPSVMVYVDGFLYVLLQNQTSDFITGKSSLVVIDTSDDSVATTLTLSKKGCDGSLHIALVAEVVIGCAGAYSDADLAEGSGLIILDVSQPQAPKVARTLHATDLGDGRAIVENVTWLGGQKVAIVAAGANDWTSGDNVTTELLYAVDTTAAAADAVEVLAEIADAYVYSTGSDVRSGKFYLGIGSFADPKLIAYDLQEDGAIVSGSELPLGDALPPRAISLY